MGNNRWLSLMIAFVFFILLSGCGAGNNASQIIDAEPTVESSNGLADDGFPSIYINGKEYPVTYEEGIRGIEDVHDGVITMYAMTEYDSERDQYADNYYYKLCRLDGTVDYDYRGERLIYLFQESTHYVSNLWASPKPDPNDILSYRALTVVSDGLPFRTEKVVNYSEYLKLMEDSGFVKQQDNRYARFYTESGVIDTTGQDFQELIREYIGNLAQFRAQISSNPNFVEEFISEKSNFDAYAYVCALSLMNKQIDESSSRMGCILLVVFDEETEAMMTEALLIVSPDQLLQWYERWGEVSEVRPQL